MIRYRAAWVVPVTTPPLRDGVVACEDGTIRYVGPAGAAPDGDEYSLGDAILLPGLVNAHTHLELTAMRGFLEELAFHDWIDVLRRARAAVLDESALLDAARLGVIEGMEHGVTTFADTSASGVPVRALAECGARGIVYHEVFGQRPEDAGAALDGLAARLDALAPLATPLVRLGVSPHAPYTVSDALYRGAAALARDRSIPLAMHIAEGEDETALVTRGCGMFASWLTAREIPVAPRARSPVALLDDLGVLGPDTLLIHAVQVDDGDVATIARSGAAVAHCPASNAKFGHGIAPVTQMLDAGVRIGLGSDSVASNNRMDILDEARLALLLQNGSLRSPGALAARTALELATIHGARALGLGDVTGSLEPGKSADLCAFRIDRARATPAEDPVATLLFALGGERATLVVVAGRHVVEDGELLLATGRLRDRVTASARALAAWRLGADTARSG